MLRSIASAILVLGSGLIFCLPNALAQKTITATSVPNLNQIIQKQAGLPAAQQIAANDVVNFSRNVPAQPNSYYIYVDETPITGGDTTIAYSLNIYKTGAGLWRLNGANTPVATNTRFQVNSGMLELMKDASITLTGSTTSVFQLNSGTSVNIRGAETGGTTIAATTITLQGNTKIGLDLTNANTGSPMLTLTGAVTVEGTGHQINLLGFRNNGDTITRQTLLQYAVPGTAAAPETVPIPQLRVVNESTGGTNTAYDPNVAVMVRGDTFDNVAAASDGRLSGTLIQQTTAAGTAFTSTISIDLISKTGEVTWAGSDGGTWDATSSLWTGMEAATTSGSGPHSFLHGDTVTFGNNNTHTITVQAGGVQIGAGSGSGSTKIYGMTVNGGNYTFVNAADNIGIDGPGGLHALSLNPTNTLNPTTITFQSANSFYGDSVIDTNAHVILEHAAGMGTSVIELKSGGKLIFNTVDNDDASGNDTFYNDIVVGSGGVGEIIKRGNNTLTLNGSVTSMANTVVEEGTLQGNIGRGVLYVYDDTTYNALNVSRSIAGLSDGPVDGPNPPNGGTVNMGTKQGTTELNLSINVAGSDEYEFSGVITGTDAKVIKDGTGRQILMIHEDPIDGYNANTYTGGTEIVGGTLTAKALLDISAADHRINIQPFGTGEVSVAQAGFLELNAQHVDLLVPVAPSDPMLVGRVGNVLRGTGTVRKTGNAVMSLYGDSSERIDSGTGQTIAPFGGEVRVEEGALRLEHNNAVGKATQIQLADATALQLSKLDPPGRTVTAREAMQGNSKANPFDRIITGTGNLEVLELTEVHVKGTNDDQEGRKSDYTGSTFVYGGANLILLNAGGTGNTSAVHLVVGDPDPLLASTLTLDFDSIDNGENGQIYDRYITGLGNLQKDGDGIAWLVKGSQANDYQGETIVKRGTLKLAYADATGVADPVPEQSVTVESGAFLELAFGSDEEYHKGIQGAGALVKSGDNKATLKGWSTYTGGTYLYGGTLSYTDADMTNQSGGNIGGGGIYFKRGGGILQNTSTVANLNQNVYIDSSSTATFDTQADLTTSYGIFHNSLSSDDPYYNPDDPKSHLVKTGSGTMTINGNANWTGSTTVKEGWLYNNVPETTDLIVYTGAGYYTGAGRNGERVVASIRGETDSSGGTITVADGTDLVVRYADTSRPDIFAGTINGGGGLVLDAVGTEAEQAVLQLTGSNTYEGETIVRGTNGKLIGNIAFGTDLTVELGNSYVSGGSDRQISSLNGYGTVDMEGRSLIINQTDTDRAPVFNGKLNNVHDLFKRGEGSQQFLGDMKISHNIEVDGGRLILGGAGYYMSVNVGNDLIVSGAVSENGIRPTLDVRERARIHVGNTLDIQGALDIIPDGSLIEVGKSVTLGPDSVLNVSGIGEEDTVLIIRSLGETIEDDFGTVTIADATAAADFLDVGVEKSLDKKEIWVGQTLRWYAPKQAHGTFTLTEQSGYYKVGRPLHDVTGTFNVSEWDGKTLTKKGPGTLELAMENTYTGKTIVEEGTLKLSHANAASASERIDLIDSAKKAGGTLELDFDSRNADGTWTKGLETKITGLGDVVKTGTRSVTVLSGANTYTGRTLVKEGALLIDGSSVSNVFVNEKAGFGGNGTVNANVTFESGSYYYWRFGATEAESDMLNVYGRLSIGDNVWFRPYTSLMSENEVVNAEGWTVVKYGELNGMFAGVDSSTSPFYSFELDYDLYGAIRIRGSRLDQPRALSDIVATSAVMAQTKMHRSAFRQIHREWAVDCPASIQQIQPGTQVPQQQAAQRGQAGATYRTAWMNFVGRGDHFESGYFNDDYSHQSYGVQTGVSLYSTCDRSFGILFGREEGKLSNDSDKVENEDYYLGLYFARMFNRNFDFLGYVGGGWQKNEMNRWSNQRPYQADFNGSTFNFDFEIGKRFYTQRGSFLRPYFGFDVEIVRSGSGEERTMDGKDSNELRHYGSTELNQVFFKVGLDVSRSWRRVDLNGGVNLNWNIADTRAKSSVYYPFVDQSVESQSADLGRFNVALNVGLNWYLTDRRNTAFYLDYTGEIHQDRKKDFSAGTGWVGFFWRF